MKKLNAPLTAFIVTVIGCSIYSQHSNAQNINIAENPVAYKYLLKHFELKGKVKSVTTNGANNYLMTTDLFDTAGRVTTMINFSGLTYKSNYTYHNNLIKISQQSAGLSPINYLFQYNKNQEIGIAVVENSILHPDRNVENVINQKHNQIQPHHQVQIMKTNQMNQMNV